MKHRNEEFIEGEKILFYGEYQIDPQNILRVAEILRFDSEDSQVGYFWVIDRDRQREDFYGIETTQDFEKYEMVNILDLELL